MGKSERRLTGRPAAPTAAPAHPLVAGLAAQTPAPLEHARRRFGDEED